ncbi:hypothetical protein COCNU_07G012870 [Cocos nucifera]|uniref:Uncharacterized protein n=1 Tax=Cocos nucifera TaxID=13894 RepID=A0A8K0N4W4_COCNU|nr:hypothetical protein COCNU_07G012870 [Cocos nucifera]
MSAPIKRLPSQRQEKAPATSTGSGASTESQNPSDSSGSINIQIPVAHDVSVLDKGFQAYIDTHKKWSDKMVVVIAERDTMLKCLRTIFDKEKEMEEWKKKLEEENSRLKAKLESARADLELTNNDLDSAHSELGIVCPKLVSIHANKESADWIIETQESQI